MESTERIPTPPFKNSFIRESLRQNLFWLRIMMEHALFIRLGLPCEDVDLIAEAQELQDAFGALLERARKISKLPTESKVEQLNEQAIALTTRIIDFKSRVLRMIICCEIRTGFNLPLLMDHIRREAIYFRAALVRLQNDLPLDPTEELIQDELFWLRIMADHSKFIAHLLDPSERSFVETARQLSARLDQDRLHARDFESMLVPQAFENSLLDATRNTVRPPVFGRGLPAPFSIGALVRFNGEAIQTTTELRDFKAAARQLIDDCRILSIIPPLLADHVLREANRAIEDLALRQKGLPRPCDGANRIEPSDEV